MKVYSLKDGTSVDHHPVDAREICRERPKEFSLENPAGQAPVQATDLVAAEAKRLADEVEKKRLADEQAVRASAIVEARKVALKARDAAEEAARVNVAAPAAKKKEAQAAADAAEKAADDADSELARLEAGGDPAPSQKVALK